MWPIRRHRPRAYTRGIWAIRRECLSRPEAEIDRACKLLELETPRAIGASVVTLKGIAHDLGVFFSAGRRRSLAGTTRIMVLIILAPLLRDNRFLWPTPSLAFGDDTELIAHQRDIDIALGGTPGPGA